MKVFRTIACGTLALYVAAATAQMAAGIYPSQPIKIFVGTPPGNTTDILARLLADKLGKAMGQSFIVENKPGAGGTLAVDAALRSKPDGYTLVMASNGSLTIAPSLFKKLPYDALLDFSPISITGQVPVVLIVSAESRYRSVADLADKANASDYSYGSAGVGTTQHLASELFKEAAHLDSVHVPYKGAAFVLNDLMAGSIQWAMESTASTGSLIAGNKLRALAVTTSKRLPSLPSVPTLVESGYPGFDASAWVMLGAPKATPKAIVDRLSAEIAKAVQSTEVQAQYAKLGLLPPFSSTPEEASAFLKTETDKWGKVVKKSGATVN